MWHKYARRTIDFERRKQQQQFDSRLRIVVTDPWDQKENSKYTERIE